ncbi:15-hydroxyprostaglandin dehydrogenase [NAD+] [Cyphomyrmex costatus]|uniref:15-hydroxyprostaglandin dehydrogenase [NAD(+)] n=1 Tax=Cyphomyrmex costatus TaxID=456900 RepID=A0A195CLA8_9HYME|nr:15-hydroxyprostaglandin dehydrogenase [NAD+] [Cyphomyrmex costatus]
MYNVQNKTVMITGAAGGLGYKYAEILLHNDAKSVAVVDLPTSNGQKAAATLENEFGKGRAVFLACDVTKADDLEKTFKKIVDAFEGLDILINNAGILNDNFWEETIDLNVKALIRGSMLAFDYMGKHKGGKGFSQSLASMYDKTGVRVVIMCPGATATSLITTISDKICDSVRIVLGSNTANLDKDSKQAVNNVSLAMLNLIQKGKNGATWVSEYNQPPYAVDFPHYSKRSLPV